MREQQSAVIEQTQPSEASLRGAAHDSLYTILCVGTIRFLVPRQRAIEGYQAGRHAYLEMEARAQEQEGEEAAEGELPLLPTGADFQAYFAGHLPAGLTPSEAQMR